MTRDQVVAEARRWVGTPYRVRGRSERGLDCLGLLVMLGRAFEIPHVDQQDYSIWPDANRLILHRLAEYLVAVPFNTRLPGCIGAFAERRLPCHVGVFSERHDVVHVIHARIASPSRVAEEPWATMPRTEMRMIGLFALPGMDL